MILPQLQADANGRLADIDDGPYFMMQVDARIVAALCSVALAAKVVDAYDPNHSSWGVLAEAEQELEVALHD